MMSCWEEIISAAAVTCSLAVLRAISAKALVKASAAFSCDTAFSLFGLCSDKVEWGMRVWQCDQTASAPNMPGGAA